MAAARRQTCVWFASALVLAVLTALVWAPQTRAAEPIQGSSGACSDFRLELLGFLDFDITDEGWVWTRNSDSSRPQYQSAAGVVTSTNVARNDTPSNHNSHDVVAHIEVDDGMEGVLSNVNEPNTEGTDNLEADDGADDLRAPEEIEMEWELGTFPNEKGQSVPQRYLPRWAWPNVGDRIWTNGHWVFDCGHAKKIGVFRPNPFPPPAFLFVGDDFWRSEIHPARAIASMRSQADVIPGSGTTPVPVTSTDLYIHGEAGFITDILNCGMDIIINGIGGDGIIPGDPDACPIKTTPIAENFEFDICLPPRPSPNAESSWRIDPGPANTVGGHQVDIHEVEAPDACENDGDEDNVLYDLDRALHVLVPLANSGVGDVEVYARRIVAGWVHPPASPLTHLHMTLDNVNLHESGDGGIIASDDGELTFFFSSVDRAPSEWVRLADYAPVADNGNSEMNDYDPSLFGDSFMSLGAQFDFYVRHDQDVNIAANVYDQDCYDNHFGDHILSPFMYVGCAIDIHETGNNDSLDKLGVALHPPDYASDPSLGLGTCPGVSGATGSATCNVTTKLNPKLFSISPPEIRFVPDYELNFTLEKLALTNEDTSDLRVTKTCEHEGEVLLVDQPTTCTIVVENPGPGLPRSVVVDDAVSGLAPGDFTIGVPTVSGDVPAGTACAVSATGFSCTLDTLRVGGTATIVVPITPHAPGTLTNGVSVSTDSNDPEVANDTSEDVETVFVPVTVEVKPGREPTPINIDSNGRVPVAVLTTPTFDATTIDVGTVCFGDAESPSERDCTEANGVLHTQDVDRDGDLDAVLHFDTPETGIDLGDTTACLIGVTRSNVHFFGCDAITTH